jgi:phage terminase large subunit GpA-like protein
MTQGDNMLRFLGLEPVEGMKGDQLWDTDAWEPKSITSVFFFEVPCPHCGKYIQFLWRQLRWPKDVAIRNIPEQAWYECQVCKGRITDGDKPKMLKLGRWAVHKNQKKMKRGKWVGLHLSKAYGPWVSCSFGSIAHGGLRARLSKDPQVISRFVNNTLALPYSIEQESIELVDESAITQNVKGYHRNTIPEACKVLSIGIDVGKMTASRVHWIVQGLGANYQSWRIAWGILDDLYQMESYINDTVFQHPKAGRMRILVGAADSRYNKPEVIRFCKRFRSRIFPIQGERYIKPDIAGASSQPHKAYQPERDDQGKALPDSMIGYRINTVYWKQWLYSAINCLYGQKQTFFFPIERDEALERHLRSEHEVMSTKRGSSEIVRSWQTRLGYEQNHYLDATIYGISIADVFGLLTHLEDGPIYTAIKETQKKAAPSSRESGNNPMGFPGADYLT